MHKLTRFARFERREPEEFTRDSLGECMRLGRARLVSGAVHMAVDMPWHRHVNCLSSVLVGRTRCHVARCAPPPKDSDWHPVKMVLVRDLACNKLLGTTTSDWAVVYANPNAPIFIRSRFAWSQCNWQENSRRISHTSSVRIVANRKQPRFDRFFYCWIFDYSLIFLWSVPLIRLVRGRIGRDNGAKSMHIRCPWSGDRGGGGSGIGMHA